MRLMWDPGEKRWDYLWCKSAYLTVMTRQRKVLLMWSQAEGHNMGLKEQCRHSMNREWHEPGIKVERPKDHKGGERAVHFTYKAWRVIWDIIWSGLEYHANRSGLYPIDKLEPVKVLIRSSDSASRSILQSDQERLGWGENAYWGIVKLLEYRKDRTKAWTVGVKIDIKRRWRTWSVGETWTN